MTTAPASPRADLARDRVPRIAGRSRLATETKHATKTTEFWAFLAVVVGILVSAALVKGGDTGGTDEFIARQAWLYVAIVTGAYLIGRGLAKSGSVEPYWRDGGNEHAGDRDRGRDRD